MLPVSVLKVSLCQAAFTPTWLCCIQFRLLRCHVEQLCANSAQMMREAKYSHMQFSLQCCPTNEEKAMFYLNKITFTREKIFVSTNFTLIFYS